jgi:hypothetical protein
MFLSPILSTTLSLARLSRVFALHLECENEKRSTHTKKSKQKSNKKANRNLKKIIFAKGCPIEKKMGHSTRRKLKKKEK